MFIGICIISNCSVGNVTCQVQTTLDAHVYMSSVPVGTKLKDFMATMQSDVNIQAQIAKLRHEVEEFAKDFPTIGFEKKTMRYNN